MGDRERKCYSTALEPHFNSIFLAVLLHGMVSVCVKCSHACAKCVRRRALIVPKMDKLLMDDDVKALVLELNAMADKLRAKGLDDDDLKDFLLSGD